MSDGMAVDHPDGHQAAAVLCPRCGRLYVPSLGHVCASRTATTPTPEQVAGAVKRLTDSISDWPDSRPCVVDQPDVRTVLSVLSGAQEDSKRDSRVRERMVALLTAIKHDAEWHDHQCRTPRVQFSAYHAEADALLSELVPAATAAAVASMMAMMTVDAARNQGAAEDA